MNRDFVEYCNKHNMFTSDELITSYLIMQVKTTGSHSKLLYTTPEFFYNLRNSMGYRWTGRIFEGPICSVEIIGAICE